jgi:hypothetical protein
MILLPVCLSLFVPNRSSEATAPVKILDYLDMATAFEAA